MRQVLFENGPEGMTVRTPFDKGFAVRMKALGAKWDKENRCWRFQEEEECAVRGLAEEFFGKDRAAHSLKSRVDDAVSEKDVLYGGDTYERLIAFAYHYGRETATREVSDKYAAHLKEIMTRAEGHRYALLLKKVIGEKDRLYFPEYAGRISKDVGGLLTRY